MCVCCLSVLIGKCLVRLKVEEGTLDAQDDVVVKD